jgi:Cupredoxin-like domain
VGAAGVVWFAHRIGDRVRPRHPAARPVFASVALMAVALSLVGCAAGPTVAGISESSLDPSLLRITAHNIAFVTTSLALTGTGPHEVAFDNQDTAPHNVGIYDTQGSEVFRGGLITGPAGIEYHLPALPPGTYVFRCDAHPGMTGTLVVA